MTEHVPIIDFPEALNRTLGDVDFLQTMLYEFQRITPDFLNRIDRALHDRDMDSLTRDAHQFKGSAANLGIKGIAAIALELEKAARIGRPAEGEYLFARMQDAVNRFNDQLDATDWSSL
jgi:HPt (histidine-containing phosphotransfer) domain-containing protein